MISVQTLLSRHGGNLLSDLAAPIFIDFNALLFCTILRVCVCVCVCVCVHLLSVLVSQIFILYNTVSLAVYASMH